MRKSLGERADVAVVGGGVAGLAAARELARRGLALGGYISFSGVLTFKKSEALRAIAGDVPLDRLLVETDAPYLTPQAVRKERNQPANVTLTAELVAAERGVPYAELEAQVERNAAELFGW